MRAFSGVSILVYRVTGAFGEGGAAQSISPTQYCYQLANDYSKRATPRRQALQSLYQGTRHLRSLRSDAMWQGRVVQAPWQSNGNPFKGSTIRWVGRPRKYWTRATAIAPGLTSTARTSHAGHLNDLELFDSITESNTCDTARRLRSRMSSLCVCLLARNGSARSC